MNILLLTLFCEFILFLIFLKYSNFDILSPATFFIFSFIIGLIFANLSYNRWEAVNHINVDVFFILISGSLIFLIINLMMYKKFVLNGSSKDFGNDTYIINNSIRKALIIIVVDAAIFYFFYRYMIYIVDKYDAFNRYNVQSLSAAYRALYGHDTIISDSDLMPGILRYGTYFIQMSAYICLYPFINEILIKKKFRYSLLLYLVPAFIFISYGLICGSRSDLIKITISGFFLFCVLFLRKMGWDKNSIIKIIKKGFLTIILLAIVFFLASIIVGRSALNGSFFDSFLLQIYGYVGAPIVHFSQYLDDPIHSAIPGEESFTNLFLFLDSHGLLEITRTTHLEYRQLVGGIYGNVYTFFRRPLSDFGYLGMYIFILVVALFFSVFYYKIVRNKNMNNFIFRFLLIMYTILVQWLAYATIDQISGEFVSVTFCIKFIIGIFIYSFIFFDIDLMKSLKNFLLKYCRIFKFNR